MADGTCWIMWLMPFCKFLSWWVCLKVFNLIQINSLCSEYLLCIMPWLILGATLSESSFHILQMTKLRFRYIGSWFNQLRGNRNSDAISWIFPPLYTWLSHAARTPSAWLSQLHGGLCRTQDIYIFNSVWNPYPPDSMIDKQLQVLFFSFGGKDIRLITFFH